MSIFKAYDIRGEYPQELTIELARKIGCAFVQFTHATTVVVGRDMRNSGNVLMPALCEGIASAGAHIIDVGLVSTPLFYFSVAHYSEHDAGIMVTASHNPAQYNGFKMVYGDGMPIGIDSGLRDIENMVRHMNELASIAYTVDKKNVVSDYIEKLYSLVEPHDISPLRVIIDAGNGMAGSTVPALFARLSCTMTPLFFEFDGTFPNHEANPIIVENIRTLSEKVVADRADCGVAYDGDADRIGFIDEKGELIPGDLIIALLAKELLREYNGGHILYDIRSSRAVAEIISECSGTSSVSRVGHAYIKHQMKQENALFAGEFSAHYYFREFGYVDNTDYALLLMLRMVSREQKPLSVLVSAVRRYAHSGEINFEVRDTSAVIERLMLHYKKNAQRFSELDGVLCDFGDWWFNVRSSNTEPKLRLVLEARDSELMEAKKQEVMQLID